MIVEIAVKGAFALIRLITGEVQRRRGSGRCGGGDYPRGGAAATTRLGEAKRRRRLGSARRSGGGD